MKAVFLLTLLLSTYFHTPKSQKVQDINPPPNQFELIVPRAIWEEIYFIPIDKRARIANLPSLRVALPKDDLELRLWNGFGVTSLEGFVLRRRSGEWSGQHERKGMGRTYVATKKNDARVLGYYTISSSAVAFDIVPENLPRHPVPVALIGRLAVDRIARRQRLGETLLIHALRSAHRAAKIVGIYAVVVDALDESARNFYLKYGFHELTDDRLHFYLPMKVIEKLSL